MSFNQNHFELFGLKPAYALDRGELERAYRDLQARIHPDRHASAGEAAQRLAVQWTARVNEAYQTLREPFERARYLLSLQGIEAMDTRHTAMPADFLLQQMQWRECLEEARAQGDADALQRLEREARGQAAALEGDLARLLDAERNYPQAAEVLRKLRFVTKFLEEIEEAHEALL